MVIVNTPHNPTAASMTGRASRPSRIPSRPRLGADRPPHLPPLRLSHRRRLRFDRRNFVSPAAVYPWTLVSYSYGKILLTPGQRLGYLAVSPLMPRDAANALRDATFVAQMALGWSFASALMQHAIPALEDLSIDPAAALTRRRDRLMAAPRRGRPRPAPAGGNLLPVQPLAGRCTPTSMEPARRPRRLRHAGSILAPDHFRISLTATR